MKLFRLCLFVFLFSFFLLGAVSDCLAETQRTVRVGIYNNKPKIYVDDNDKASGVYADILNYIAQKENWNLVYVPGQWNKGLERLKAGEIDIMVDMALSPERQAMFDFTSETVMNSWAEVYVQKDSSINSILDLKDKKISIIKSSVYEHGVEGIDDYLKAFGITATKVEVENYRVALDLLEMDKVDVAIVSHIFAMANEKDYTNIKATRIFLKPTELRFALTKGDSDNKYLIERLDYWVKKLKGGYENFYHKTLEKYGLQELEGQAGALAEKQKTQSEFLVLKAIIGVLIVLLTFCIALKIVSKRTGEKITKLLRIDKIKIKFGRK